MAGPLISRGGRAFGAKIACFLTGLIEIRACQESI